jgi:hypothetical protein
VLNILGVDLGQASDYTALAGVEVVPTLGVLPYVGQDEETGLLVDRTMPIEGLPVTFNVRHLERFALGTEYPTVVDGVAERLRKVPGGAVLVVDATGVGRPVVDLLVARGLDPVAITITGGETPRIEGRHWHVPKRDLIAVLQVALQNHRMRFPGKLAAVEDLIRELLGLEFKVSIAGNVTMGAWREGSHDDLVLALALACWLGERHYSALTQARYERAETERVGAMFDAAGGISPI